TEELAISPLYYNDKFEFSNNQFIISKNYNPSDLSCIEFLEYGYLPFSDSLYTEVKRKHPDEILKFSLEEKSIKSIPIPLNFHKGYQFDSIEKSLEDLNKAFIQFFSRIKDQRTFFGLSGGYDSRIIAAYLQNTNSSCIHYLNSDKTERLSAEKVSILSNIPIKKEKFPKDSPFLYFSKFSSRFINLSSFEYSHVLHLQENSLQKEYDVYIDGYIGDTILGGTYFETKKKDLIYSLKYISFLEKFNSRIPDKNILINYLTDKESLFYQNSDLPESYKKFIYSHKNSLLEKLLPHSKNLETLEESWKHYTRARKMISMGPTGINLQIPAFSPFIDKKIKSICFSIPQEYRNMDRIYNLFWKKYFSEFSKIPKSRTGGKAYRGNFIYRLQHIINNIIKKIQKSNSEEYISIRDYISHPNNLFLKELIENSNNQFLSNFQKAFYNLKIPKSKEDQYFLRMASLGLFLKEGKLNELS
ncbi:MAG: hypothetical protein KDK36_12945, partial [Leptospiraceae bacterium]|nr:hypothetical protein [Leptospiraceae bacterium]